MLINTCVWAYLQIHEGLLRNKEKGKPKHTCLWGLTPNTAELKEKEHASDPRVQYVGRKSKKKPILVKYQVTKISVAVLEEGLSLQHALPAAWGKAGAGAACRAVQAANPSSLLAPEMQHRMVGVNKWSAALSTYHCLSMSAFSSPQWLADTKTQHLQLICNSPRGWPLISEPSRSVWPEE